MSNRLFQSVIHQMREAVDKTIGVIDETGAVISCSDLSKIGEVRNVNTSAIFSSNAPVVSENLHIRVLVLTFILSVQLLLKVMMNYQRAILVCFVFLFQV